LAAIRSAQLVGLVCRKPQSLPLLLLAALLWLLLKEQLPCMEPPMVCACRLCRLLVLLLGALALRSSSRGCLGQLPQRQQQPEC